MSGLSNKTPKIFITHSSDDREYVRIFTKLLRSLGLKKNSVICTSDPIFRAPNGAEVYDWLKEQFLEYDLHMIFILSHNYYESVPCLNEMGAAWLTAKKSDILLLPDFSYSDLRDKGGVLGSNTQGGSIDSEDIMLKVWLNELRDEVVDEFGIERILIGKRIATIL